MKFSSIVDYNECITPMGWKFDNITRPFTILYYVLGGTAYYTVDGISKKFLKDRLYIIPANTVISEHEDTRDKFYSLYIHAYTELSKGGILEIDVNSDSFIFDTLALMRKYVAERSTACIESLTDMLVSYICNSSEKNDVPLYRKIKDYIEKNPEKVFKSENLTERFNYSKSHINRIFKENMALTTKQYAMRIILTRSLQMLYDGLCVREISDKFEFSSPENFSRFFKKFYGVSPKQYVKLNPYYSTLTK
jgi:AraC-like DNA-binding protein